MRTFLKLLVIILICSCSSKANTQMIDLNEIATSAEYRNYRLAIRDSGEAIALGKYKEGVKAIHKKIDDRDLGSKLCEASNEDLDSDSELILYRNLSCNIDRTKKLLYTKYDFKLVALDDLDKLRNIYNEHYGKENENHINKLIETKTNELNKI